METTANVVLNCPIPITTHDRVMLAHGGGGKLMHQLIEKYMLPVFSNPLLETRHDGAILQVTRYKLAFTTDSYVVRPLFFPGGDIGGLAVNGTVNDLAMCGARPLYLSCALILEEGLPLETLWRVLQSMRAAADIAGVQLVTGDTKVVDKGKGDGIFINTSGIGVIEHNMNIAPRSVRAGDAIVLSGDIGRHSIAITAVRDGLQFESEILSDCAPVSAQVQALLDAGIEIHCMRDLTRGGLASALIEISEASGLQIGIEETLIPVLEEVRGACEMLGFDPLYLANEGRFVAFVPEKERGKAEDVLKRFESSATVIGSVQEGDAGLVTLLTRIGTSRIVDMLSGEQLPRIC